MKSNVTKRLVAVFVLSLVGGITLQSTPTSAATTSVSVTLTGVTPEMAAKGKEAAAEQAALEEAWLQAEIDDSESVDVNGQTTHYWEAADGTRHTTAPVKA